MSAPSTPIDEPRIDGGENSNMSARIPSPTAGDVGVIDYLTDLLSDWRTSLRWWWNARFGRVAPGVSPSDTEQPSNANGLDNNQPHEAK